MRDQRFDPYGDVPASPSATPSASATPSMTPSATTSTTPSPKPELPLTGGSTAAMWIGCGLILLGVLMIISVRKWSRSGRDSQGGDD